MGSCAGSGKFSKLSPAGYAQARAAREMLICDRFTIVPSGASVLARHNLSVLRSCEPSYRAQCKSKVGRSCDPPRGHVPG